MSEFLYKIMEQVAIIHDKLLGLNDSWETNFNDKELHFLIIGIIGMLGIIAIYPLFKLLAAKGHVMVIAWIYVFTMIIVLTFAIEIGQRYSHTGVMDFADIVFGVVGFIVMFAVFSVVRGMYHMIVKFVKRNRSGRSREGE